MPTKKDFYTYTEAQAAAQVLGINNPSDYKKRRREDQRLPSKPNALYANAGWKDWYDFLGNARPDWYPTYAEAQAAAEALGIKNQPDYKERRREDQRLPSNPSQFYAAAGWKDWYNFLGNTRPDWYPAYAEAQAAAQALGIKSHPDYKKRRREDQRLPSKPYRFYANAGWKDWYDFLGNARPDWYPTYAEAQAAAQALGIKSRPDYLKRYREDRRLPSSPDVSYANAGWNDWYDFLGSARRDWYPTYAEAKAATLTLGIKNQSDFRKRYREGVLPRFHGRFEKG